MTTPGYLFDTNAVSELPRPRPNPDYVRWVATLPFTAQTVSSVTITELFRGATRTRAATRHMENIRSRVLPNVLVLPFDAQTAEIYGKMWDALWDAGTPTQGSPASSIRSQSRAWISCVNEGSS